MIKRLPIHVIADFQLPIADWQVDTGVVRLRVKAFVKVRSTIGNWQLEIGNE